MNFQPSSGAGRMGMPALNQALPVPGNHTESRTVLGVTHFVPGQRESRDAHPPLP